MSELIKETIGTKLEELKNLPRLSWKNAAFSFEQSASGWHPRYLTVMPRLIADVKSQYETIMANIEDIEKAIAEGKAYTTVDWGGGWEWHPTLVKVNGITFRVFDKSVCIYGGQHDKPVVDL